MKLRLKRDNWDYGTVGERVQIYNEFGLPIEGDYFVGDIYSITYSNLVGGWRTTNCMVVNKIDEYSDKKYAFFMGMGIDGLRSDEKVNDLIYSFKAIEIGDIYENLIVTES